MVINNDYVLLENGGLVLLESGACGALLLEGQIDEYKASWITAAVSDVIWSNATMNSAEWDEQSPEDTCWRPN